VAGSHTFKKHLAVKGTLRKKDAVSLGIESVQSAVKQVTADCIWG
jgi:hypothetical protein